MKKLVLLFFIAFFVYAFSFPNQFLWDDEQFIVKNSLVQNISTWPTYFTTNTVAGAGFNSNYYRPLTTFSFAIDFAIWGLHPFGFHLTNTLLHALGGVLVFILLRKLLKLHSADGKYELLAFVTALAFVLHPAQVEAVAYMNSRGDSLSLVYGVATALFLIKIQETASENRRILFGLAAFFAYVISVLSKESGIVWVGISFLYIFLLHTDKKKVRLGVILTASLQLAAALLYLLLRFTVLQFQSTDEVWGGSSVYAHSIFIRLGTFLTQSIPQYISILLWPFHLHMERNVEIVNKLSSIAPISIVVLMVFVLTTTAISVYLIKKRAKLSHPFFVGLLLLVMLIFPFSGVMPLNGVVYEHWLYAPMIGWWLACFYLAQHLLHKRIFLGLTVTILTTWAVLSILQIFHWRSPMAFYTYTLQYADSARLHMNLGMAYADENNLEEAIAQYNTAIQLSDQYPQTHYNLGNAYVTLKDYDRAEQEYAKSLELDPSFVFSINTLIQLEIALKNKQKAEKWTKYALEKFPGNQQYEAVLQRIESSQW